jgi:hypothetical protein
MRTLHEQITPFKESPSHQPLVFFLHDILPLIDRSFSVPDVHAPATKEAGSLATWGSGQHRILADQRHKAITVWVEGLGENQAIKLSWQKNSDKPPALMLEAYLPANIGTVVAQAFYDTFSPEQA